jgi:hypothetical protein
MSCLTVLSLSSDTDHITHTYRLMFLHITIWLLPLFLVIMILL